MSLSQSMNATGSITGSPAPSFIRRPRSSQTGHFRSNAFSTVDRVRSPSSRQSGISITRWTSPIRAFASSRCSMVAINMSSSSRVARPGITPAPHRYQSSRSSSSSSTSSAKSSSALLRPPRGSPSAGFWVVQPIGDPSACRPEAEKLTLARPQHRSSSVLSRIGLRSRSIVRASAWLAFSVYHALASSSGRSSSPSRSGLERAFHDLAGLAAELALAEPRVVSKILLNAPIKESST